MTYFRRSGTEVTKPIQHENRSHFIVERKICNRCGGAGGASQWNHTGWTCYDCGGEGHRGTHAVPVYTAEKLAQLNAAQAKRDAKRLAKHEAERVRKTAEFEAQVDSFLAKHGALIDEASEFASNNNFIADLIHKAYIWLGLTEKQDEALRNAIERERDSSKVVENSRWVGEVGDRLVLRGTVERMWSGESHYGSFYIITIRGDDGQCYVYKGGSHLASNGESVALKATVVAHDQYRDEKQTVINRPAVIGEAA
jgi:hypothetical protein